MIKVGITGGIGSGKTTVCSVFKTLNVPVYNADWEARQLTDQHADIIKGVSKLFGADIYQQNGLDRPKVASMVFENKELLSQLNEIIHPVVANHFENWIQQHKDCKYIIKEAAILFESGGNKQVDKIVVVTAPLELRIKRVMQRDGLSEQEILNRMNNQMPEDKKMSMSDYIIHCNNIDLVIPQVLSLHEKLMRLA